MAISSVGLVEGGNSRIKKFQALREVADTRNRYCTQM